MLTKENLGNDEKVVDSRNPNFDILRTTAGTVCKGVGLYTVFCTTQATRRE